MKKEQQNKPFLIAEKEVLPGAFDRIELPSASLYTQTPLHIPVYVVHGQQTGPKLFITATIHGDELNGGEIIRRVMRLPIIRKLAGTLVTVPIANIYGFMAQSRYLPDRRDLNRMFPGSKTGSLAARLAHLLMTEIIQKCEYGIDLHTAAANRNNLPQIRYDAESTEAEKLAKAFGAPVILRSNKLPGSLRDTCTNLNIPLLVYEAGEALRFDEAAIRIGVQGILAVMQELGMISTEKKPSKIRPTLARSAMWVRAPASGIVQTQFKLGSTVQAKQILGFIVDPFTDHKKEIFAPITGVVIGKTNLPLLNEGDAVFHLACVKERQSAVVESDEMKKAEHLYIDPMLDGWT